MPKTQRQGVASRLTFLKEVTWNDDTGITAGFAIPLSDTSGVEMSRALNEVPVYVGRRRFPGVVSGNATTGGDFTPQMEFDFIGHILEAFFGASGYDHLDLGTTDLHTFYMPDVDGALPQSFQLQAESLEAPIQYLRAKGCYANSISMQGQQQGGASYGVNVMGSGEKGLTALDSSPTIYPFKAVDSFNGFLNIDGIDAVGALDFSCNINNNFTRTDAYFNSGIASSLVAGIPTGAGKIGLIMGVAAGADPEDTINFYNMAINQTDIKIECMYADGPNATADKFMHQRMVVRFMEKNWKPAGNAGIMIDQDFMLNTSILADWPGEMFCTLKGPYDITVATEDTLDLRIDGGSANVITITSGASVSAQTIVDDINGFSWVDASATADVYMGRVRVVSDTTGSTSDVQVANATSTCQAKMGWDVLDTVFAGYDDTPCLITLYNDTQVAY